jgi:hypothetical protein
LLVNEIYSFFKELFSDAELAENLGLSKVPEEIKRLKKKTVLSEEEKKKLEEFNEKFFRYTGYRI